MAAALLAGTGRARPSPAPAADSSAWENNVAFGYVPPGVVPPPNYEDPASFVGYPELLAQQQLHVHVANASCPARRPAACCPRRRRATAARTRSRGREAPHGLPAARPISERAGRLRAQVPGASQAHEPDHDRHRRQRRLRLPGDDRRPLHLFRPSFWPSPPRSRGTSPRSTRSCAEPATTRARSWR